ncbi:hypothetical protein VTN31DRAFT_1067 [Thermomyces dupontii]|uniref:uncharacterized protein n=1 Tax=Talaromyces thermophilus TaxID=28565 RepID=UPI003742E1E7
MLVDPSVRKDLITLWPPVCIQDDPLPPPDFLPSDPQLSHCRPAEQHVSHHHHPPPSLDSPFQSPSRNHLTSPSHVSSGAASPVFSSPSFSAARTPVTAASNDFSYTAGDGGLYDAPLMSAAPSCNSEPQIHDPSLPSYLNGTSPYPTPHLHNGSPMLAQQQSIATNPHGWDSDSTLQLLSPVRAQSGITWLHGATRKRPDPSWSTNKPQGNPSQTTSFTPSCDTSSLSQSDTYPSTKALPTPVQTPVHSSLLAAPFQNYDPSSQNGDNAAAEQAMRQAVMEQQQHQQQQAQPPNSGEDGSFHSSLVPSVSGMNRNSPVTPQTTTAYDDPDDGSKAVVHGEDRASDRWMDEYLQFDARPDFNGQVPVGVPKLNRTISDIYQDELYNATVVPSPQVRKPNPSQQFTSSAPYRNIIADRLNAASQGHMSARSGSPNTMHRESSPFRQNSPLAAEFESTRLSGSGLSTAMQAMASQQSAQTEPKTISPKDALLEYHEGPNDAAMPLFPSNQNGSDFGGLDTDSLSLRRQSASTVPTTQSYSQMDSFPTQYTTQAGLQQPQSNNFLQQHHHHPRRTDPYLQPMSGLPAVPSTAESTVADGTSSRQESIHRPDDTSSDSGTYTCTYHGCTLRFETPAQLQKHKREAHRSTMPGTRDGSLGMRNSQAGPHRCERINPSTGKPCNSVFSRPYDLTRHEDTIHNSRKQKVRCHLCTEEKTFSRNDALTRHMRVVHPDVDWPGKQRRRGRD